MQLKIGRLNVFHLLIGALLVAGQGSINLAQQADCKNSKNASKSHSKLHSKLNKHDATLTGEYDYKLGRNESSLYVREQAPGKIQFALKSLWIGNPATGNVHTGEAGGIVELKDNKGIFKNDLFTLSFEFTPGHCAVACKDCSGFGGVNVDPNGIYKKINSAVPSAGDLDTYQ